MYSVWPDVRAAGLSFSSNALSPLAWIRREIPVPTRRNPNASMNSEKVRPTLREDKGESRDDKKAAAHYNASYTPAKKLDLLLLY